MTTPIRVKHTCANMENARYRMFLNMTELTWKIQNI